MSTSPKEKMEKPAREKLAISASPVPPAHLLLPGPWKAGKGVRRRFILTDRERHGRWGWVSEGQSLRLNLLPLA